MRQGVVWDDVFALRADLYLPAQATPRSAAVIMFHGGGWAAGRREEMAWFGNLFARAGLVAISADYRLIDGASVFAEDQIRDVRFALTAAIANAAALGIDPARVGVLGGSAGGHLAAMLATDGDLPVRSAAILWGPTDLTTPLSALSSDGANILRRYLTSARSSAAALSPALRIDRPGACRRWLLIHGQRDELVPASQSRSMHARLRGIGARSEYLELPGEAHFPEDPAKQELAARALVAFFGQL
ncbi:MAG: alpha/beta hydrolase [Hyphomonadaceae bacterium]|nr:alpha/beta hydrolase [Hyphomonadaceae bacterium]